MRIGTAYPEPEELEAVRHHFVGMLSVVDDYNVSRYEKDALGLLENLFSDHKVVILTGGSGLYIDAVCKGIDDLPDYDPELRKKLKRELKEQGLQAFGDRLKELDPDYHEVVDLQNPNRLLRALEVCIQTGRTYTSLRKNTARSRPFNILKIGLNTERDVLFERIAGRVDSMMKKGLLDEVRSLQSFRRYNALNTVGYKELFSFLDGDLSLEEAVEKIKTNTRRYAKRQLTWFKRDDDIQWFKPDQLKEVITFLEASIRP
jgi:tRNA dimethylallyltransferase